MVNLEGLRADATEVVELLRQAIESVGVPGDNSHPVDLEELQQILQDAQGLADNVLATVNELEGQLPRR